MNHVYIRHIHSRKYCIAYAMFSGFYINLCIKLERRFQGGAEGWYL